MAANEGEACIELTIPGRPEFVGVARLAILGVASRMRFSYDEVEDIRLAVGEACTTAIERASGTEYAGEPIRIRCLVDSLKLVVEVCDRTGAVRVERIATTNGGFDDRNLGSVLIRILMDDVTTHTDPVTGQRVVRMVKHVAHAVR